MKTNNRGFTLLEMIVVLFMITLILGMSTVFFAGFLPGAKLEAAGREMSGLIKQARSLARLEMQSKTFTIDLDARSYGIEGREAKLLPATSQIKIVDPLLGELIQGKYHVVFQPMGSAGGGTIILMERKKVLMINVEPISGAVLIRG